MNTLMAHLWSTYRKLGVESRAAAIERGTSLDRDGPTATSDSAIIPLG
jgi:hypothetical protein